jgi:hypothetical protein
MSRPTTLPQPWRSLADKLGGVQALADALCCDPVTLRRWANGSQTPNRATQAWIRRGFEEVGIEPPSFGKQIEND